MTYQSRFISAAALSAALASLAVVSTTAAPAASQISVQPVSTLAVHLQPTIDRAYKQGDVISVGGWQSMAVQLDEKMSECLVYAPSGTVKFNVPFSTDRRVYPPDAFTGEKHKTTSRPATTTELTTYRNVALNPYDPRGESTFYPHATSNSECRNDPDFAARNAIDGSKTNAGHGKWPYQSWGPGEIPDPWWKLEFGRPVIVDKLVLYIRADFPHDKYWHKATVQFSDGGRETIEIKKTAEAQEFKFKKRTITWLKITDFVQEQPPGWCALTELEVWGRDAIVPSK